MYDHRDLHVLYQLRSSSCGISTPFQFKMVFNRCSLPTKYSNPAGQVIKLHDVEQTFVRLFEKW